MSKLEVDAIEPQSGTTLTLGASGDTVNIASGATITDFTSTGIDDNATSTAITIDSNERVGIGTSPSTFTELSSTNPSLVVGSGSADSSIYIYSASGSGGTIAFTDLSTAGGGNQYRGLVQYIHSDDSMRLYTNSTERMRINSSGDVGIGKIPDGSVATTGTEFGNEGYALLARSANTVLYVNRKTNDGTVISIRQDGTEEGGIDVTGSAVSYNGFTGTHWSRFTDNSKPNILRGTVLESLDEMCDWYNLEFDVTTQDEDGNDVTTTQKIPHVLADGQSDGDVITYNHEGTDVQATIVKEADIKHVKSKVSDTVDAKNVYGVFNAWDEDGEGYNDFYVASVGSFVVRIKAGETVAKGDLLQSNGDGTAKVQSDDAVRSSSFAKVLSTTVIETYEDGSYLVPCSLMC